MIRFFLSLCVLICPGLCLGQCVNGDCGSPFVVTDSVTMQTGSIPIMTTTTTATSSRSWAAQPQGFAAGIQSPVVVVVGSQRTNETSSMRRHLMGAPHFVSSERLSGLNERQLNDLHKELHAGDRRVVFRQRVGNRQRDGFIGVGFFRGRS